MKLIDNDKLIKSMNIVEVPYRSISSFESIYYEDYIDRLLIATDASEFKQIREIAYAHNADGRILSAITKSAKYYIDNNEVDEDTFEDVIETIELRMYVATKERCVWETINETNGTTIWRIKEKNSTIGWKIADPQLPKDVIKHTLAEYVNSFRESKYDNGSAAEAIRLMLKEHLNIIDEKENEDMPKIVNYKYNEEKGLTEITWSDKTITRVVAGDDTEKSAYVGFVSACAKKLFGNKSTYLNQFDKWTVKIPERERIAAEKKAAEDKAHEEAKARKAAKKAERKRKRDIEIRAKQLADMYYSQEIEDEADKIAHEKYGVPMDWLNN